MERLIYYLHKGEQYEPFIEYSAETVGRDEFYARQLCHYFIYRGTQYELFSNELENELDVIVVKEIGRNRSGEDERSFRGQGIHLEFRRPDERANYPLLLRISCETHFDVIRYLLKHVVTLPDVGQMLVTSTEIDEDRGVYVMYVTELEVSAT